MFIEAWFAGCALHDKANIYTKERYRKVFIGKYITVWLEKIFSEIHMIKSDCVCGILGFKYQLANIGVVRKYLECVLWVDVPVSEFVGSSEEKFLVVNLQIY